MTPFPYPACLCPLGRRRRFPGLGRNDTTILADALDKGIIAPDCMWTSVPCGCCPDWSNGRFFRDDLNQIDSIHRKRIDLIFKTGAALHLVEVKPHASYVALGQVLMYAALWKLDNPELPFAQVSILTDQPDRDLPRVIPQFGVTLLQTGNVADADPNYPT